MDILHKVGVADSSTSEVYDALTTLDGLTGWWASDTSGDPSIGGVLQFRFEAGGIDMEVVELEPDRRVRWRVTDGPEEWLGTSVRWDLRQDDGWATVLFTHEGWGEPVEFMHHCSTKWALFLMSLKELVETGKGSPEPHDVKLGNWG
jgi:uncharacterized protein YndB with AHSA1/START domain